VRHNCVTGSLFSEALRILAPSFHGVLIACNHAIGARAAINRESDIRR
jgi:hypothetical protein